MLAKGHASGVKTRLITRMKTAGESFPDGEAAEEVNLSGNRTVVGRASGETQK